MLKLRLLAPLWPLLFSVSPLRADLVTRLAPQTLNHFEAYVQDVETDLTNRSKSTSSFLTIDSDSDDRARVFSGEFVIRPELHGGSISIPGGLIHDWVGTAFIPNSTAARVLEVLQDFDHHKDIYPDVIASKLVQRSGDDLEGYWRLQQKSIVTVVLDVQQVAHYQQLPNGSWICRSYSRDISEVADAGTTREHKFSHDQGHGYLWRLNAYWSLEQVNGGVLIECRTVSLSRNVPAMLSWIVKPMVHGVPKDSLLSTLRDTRAAAGR